MAGQAETVPRLGRLLFVPLLLVRIEPQDGQHVRRDRQVRIVLEFLVGRVLFGVRIVVFAPGRGIVVAPRQVRFQSGHFAHRHVGHACSPVPPAPT